jgi:AraC-like DNA-binding protein
MITNFNILLMAGGRYRCTPAWDKSADAIDACFKMYLVAEGSAELHFRSGRHVLRAGRIYLIDGHRLVSQRCPRRMDVFWVHFVPESLLLSHELSALPPVMDATAESAPQADEWPALMRIFEQPRTPLSRPLEAAPLAALCRVHGLLLHLIGHAVERSGPDLPAGARDELTPFRRVIEIMDARFREPLALAELARAAGLAPAYFHRRFHAVFGLTPRGYLLRRRMNFARHLLSDPALRIHEIAAAAGYDNPLYFSRVFRRHFGFRPSDRRTLSAAGKPPAGIA